MICFKVIDWAGPTSALENWSGEGTLYFAILTERHIYLGNMIHRKAIDLDRTSVHYALFQTKYNNKKLCAGGIEK